MLRSGHFFDPPSGTCLWSLCCSKCFCWSNIERNWHKKKWTRFSLKNHGRWQPGSPRYLRTNRGTYRQFNRIKNWRKFMVKKSFYLITFVGVDDVHTKLILFFYRASVLSEVQTSRNSQLPTSKNLLVLGKLKKFLCDHTTQIRYVFSRNFCYKNEIIILFIFL